MRTSRPPCAPAARGNTRLGTLRSHRRGRARATPPSPTRKPRCSSGCRRARRAQPRSRATRRRRCGHMAVTWRLHGGYMSTAEISSDASTPLRLDGGYMAVTWRLHEHSRDLERRVDAAAVAVGRGGSRWVAVGRGRSRWVAVGRRRHARRKASGCGRRQAATATCVFACICLSAKQAFYPATLLRCYGRFHLRLPTGGTHSARQG